MSGQWQLKGLAEQVVSRALGPRVLALETLARETASAVARLEDRLGAIEDAVRQARPGDDDVREIDPLAKQCSGLVDEHVPMGQRVAVLTEGDPAVFAPNDWPVAAFPHGSRTAQAGSDFGHGAGLIAQLEVQRIEGSRFLLVPEPSRSWLHRFPELAEHLTDRYDVVADEPAVGVLVNLGTRQLAPRQQQTLIEVLDRAGEGNRYAAVLDWTDLDLDSLVAGRNVFTAPGGHDGKLPYLDGTIDVVVIQDPARLEEGRRVARGAVVVVGPAEDGGILVAGTEVIRGDEITADEPVLVVVAVEPGDPWLARVEEAVVAQPHVTVVAGRDPWKAAAAADPSVVIVAERGVLPLPGCIETSAALLLSDDRIGGVAPKLLAADGSLEAAGSMVFADGSVENISADCSELAAAWHEYVRPVCTTTGLLTTRAAALRDAQIGSGSFTGVSAALWRAGYELHYQPDAWAVRALVSEGVEMPDEVASEGWAQALSARPERPVPLDTRAWRSLLAHEEVAGCWS